MRDPRDMKLENAIVPALRCAEEAFPDRNPHVVLMGAHLWTLLRSGMPLGPILEYLHGIAGEYEKRRHGKEPN